MKNAPHCCWTCSGSFPVLREINELLASVREDQANQRRLKSLAEARRLFTGRHYEECLSLLARLQREFPGDPECAKLSQAARDDQAQQYRQEGIARAGKLLATRRYEECRALLAELEERFPKDDEIARLAEVSQRGRSGTAQVAGPGRSPQPVRLLPLR